MSSLFGRFIDSTVGSRFFLEAFTQLGTFAGAISGVRMASVKHFDWFGAYVIGFITALGGGTLRDVLLGVTPFWMEDPSYLVTTFLAVLAVALFGRRFISEQITWFIFDTISISIFMVIGMEKVWLVKGTPIVEAGGSFGVPEAMGLWWLAITMGVITAVFGGVMRDICINDVPLIFRKEIYALACAAGGFVHLALLKAGVDGRICGVVCMATIFAIRALAIKYHLGVPVLTGRRAIRTHFRVHPRQPAREPATMKKEEGQKE